MESESKVIGVEEEVDVDDKIDDVIEEESGELINKVVDLFIVEFVYVDVVKLGVVVVGDVEGIEEVKINVDGENFEVVNKFD